jgi:hypothetical protein
VRSHLFVALDAIDQVLAGGVRGGQDLRRDCMDGNGLRIEYGPSMPCWRSR